MLFSWKKIFLAAAWGMLAASGTSFAERLLTKEEALKGIFGPDARITTETKELTETQLSQVKQELGGKLVFSMKDGKSKAIANQTIFEFYFAVKGGKKTGVAFIDTQPGRWEMIEMIVAMDLTGTVTQVRIMDYAEKRGQPIAGEGFLNRFIGKSGRDRIKVNKDIRGISGATISSAAACFGVKKAVVLYNALYLAP